MLKVSFVQLRVWDMRSPLEFEEIVFLSVFPLLQCVFILLMAHYKYKASHTECEHLPF